LISAIPRGLGILACFKYAPTWMPFVIETILALKYDDETARHVGHNNYSYYEQVCHGV